MSYRRLRTQVQAASKLDEHQVVTELLDAGSLTDKTRLKILDSARELVAICRQDPSSNNLLDAFLLEFGLSNAEGVALMCLAEALLRVPDDFTADRLIAEKLLAGKWSSHRGQSNSTFVNASTWGLMLTGQIVSLDKDTTEYTDTWLKTLTARMGEPVIRAAVTQAMRIMGSQYVLGRDLQEGLKRGARQNTATTRFSFDMLGEGARTENDAQKYYQAYAEAIDQIGVANKIFNNSIEYKDSISVKLSALYSRYQFAQSTAVMSTLFPRIRALCLLAKKHDIGLSIDAEETFRLDPCLDIFEKLAMDPALKDWQGLGFVLQAYQKNAPSIAQWLIELARNAERRLLVRLVKGAYWDAEIKHAQEMGLNDYPVFTRKSHTDLCYQRCAELLLQANAQVMPQFATHNAYTVATLMHIGQDKQFEFQRLHGMGKSIYHHLQRQYPEKDVPVRVYAPIGSHDDLLPYLVRRLLENGANSSFVNRFMDLRTPLESLLTDLEDSVKSSTPFRHQLIPTPPRLFQQSNPARINSKGIDLDCPVETAQLLDKINGYPIGNLEVNTDGKSENNLSQSTSIFNPSNTEQIVGHYHESTAAQIDQSVTAADAAYPSWNQLGHSIRADILRKAADLMEENSAELIALLVKEAGRTIADSVSELREAVDFLRYYSQCASQSNTEWSERLQGTGVFLCISPWNFPLAIFTGQITAALVAGNTVIAKPAEQTPMVSNYAVELLKRAGVPDNAIHLLLGNGSRIGQQLIIDPRITGIAFTGSTDTALKINRQLAERPGEPVPFIAETGGQNCMLVDSTALPEQVVDDVITSAFTSAGQRCSALRVLFLQDDIADKVLTMLSGAMACIKVGNPDRLSTDIGPVIDQAAQNKLNQHIKRMTHEAKLVDSVVLSNECKSGTFVAPHVFEIDSLSQLEHEVFGPILHVIRYAAKDLHQVIDHINSTGYGLTLGIHSRIKAFADTVFNRTTAGNVYINRNMVGAVVGVNPFGGHGMSGTGPKAGGPNYLFKFSTLSAPSKCSSETYEMPESDLDKTQRSNSTAIKSICSAHQWRHTALTRRMEIVAATNSALQGTPIANLAKNALDTPLLMPGPTGEENKLTLIGRERILLIVRKGDSRVATQRQIATALLCGSSVVVACHADSQAMIENIINQYLIAGVPRETVHIEGLESIKQWIQHPDINAVVTNSEGLDSQLLRRAMAQRNGAIIPLIQWPLSDAGYHYAWLFQFLNERTRTENLVARGGNTQLFSLEENPIHSQDETV